MEKEVEEQSYSQWHENLKPLGSESLALPQELNLLSVLGREK